MLRPNNRNINVMDIQDRSDQLCLNKVGWLPVETLTIFLQSTSIPKLLCVNQPAVKTLTYRVSPFISWDEYEYHRKIKKWTKATRTQGLIHLSQYWLLRGTMGQIPWPWPPHYLLEVSFYIPRILLLLFSHPYMCQGGEGIRREWFSEYWKRGPGSPFSVSHYELMVLNGQFKQCGSFVITIQNDSKPIE